MFTPVDILKENAINKILRKQKRDRSLIYVLYHSLWDDYSQRLVEAVKEKYTDIEDGVPVYLLNTFNTSHSTLIFKDRDGYPISKVPCLVRVDSSIQVEEYLPRIWRALGVS